MKSAMPTYLGLNSCKTDTESDFNDFYEEVKGDKFKATCHDHRDSCVFMTPSNKNPCLTSPYSS